MARGRSLACREGRVAAIVERREALTVVQVELDGRPARAIGYHDLTGPLEVGDRVTLNTTGVDLGLGTGGSHFVMAVRGRRATVRGPGHIMKLRYTPCQLKVFALEEEDSPYRRLGEEIPDLSGLPVVVGGLHSQVPVAAAAVKAADPSLRVVYVMTDGGALPAAFSELLGKLRRAGILSGVITAGHAFGGDLEAVTAPSAIAAASLLLQADVVLVAMGPGVVGTGTPLGTTAIEQGPLLDAAGALGGTAIAAARVGFADPRVRHRGISHHTMTALTRFAARPALVPLPALAEAACKRVLEEQATRLEEAGHEVLWRRDAKEHYEAARAILREASIKVTTMGRGDRDDPAFFWTAASAGVAAVERRAEGGSGERD